MQSALKESHTAKVNKNNIAPDNFCRSFNIIDFVIANCVSNMLN